MRIAPETYLTLTLAGIMLSPISLAFARDSDHEDRPFKNRTVCEKSAATMYTSCHFETAEELYATTAQCINQTEPDDPAARACLRTAYNTYIEDRQGCNEQMHARKKVCTMLGENAYGPDALLDSANFVEEPDDSNPYFSLKPGHTYVARAGEGFEETVVVSVTDEVREVLGVNCRRVVDIVLVKEEGELTPIEVTDDYYAQAINGDVHYCGELARNFEDGQLVNLDGSFEAGRDLAKSGVLIKAYPASFDAHRQEYLLGEAEDVIQYISGADNPTDVGSGEGGDNANFPCYGSCIKTQEFIPPEPGIGEFKYFTPGIGFVLGVALEDGVPTGERDEVTCVGETLDVLDNPDCGIENPAELKQALCELSPDVFCNDEP
jgi:hypothetical protein